MVSPTRPKSRWPVMPSDGEAVKVPVAQKVAVASARVTCMGYSFRPAGWLQALKLGLESWKTWTTACVATGIGHWPLMNGHRGKPKIGGSPRNNPWKRRNPCQNPQLQTAEKPKGSWVWVRVLLGPQKTWTGGVKKLPHCVLCVAAGDTSMEVWLCVCALSRVRKCVGGGWDDAA